MLRKTVYVGHIVWGQTKTGYDDHYDGPVLRSGEGDCGPARHEALIERPLWDAVQMRLANEDERPCGHSASALCAGGPAPTSCYARDSCQSECREPRIAMSVAEPAVLRDVARLRPGRPWTPAALDEVLCNVVRPGLQGLRGGARPRPPSTDVAQEAGLIRYVRGAITVLDRAGLEAAACERYGIIRAQYVRALG